MPEKGESAGGFVYLKNGLIIEKRDHSGTLSSNSPRYINGLHYSCDGVVTGVGSGESVRGDSTVVSISCEVIKGVFSAEGWGVWKESVFSQEGKDVTYMLKQITAKIPPIMFAYLVRVSIVGFSLEGVLSL